MTVYFGICLSLEYYPQLFYTIIIATENDAHSHPAIKYLLKANICDCSSSPMYLGVKPGHKNTSNVIISNARQLPDI